MTSQRKLRLCEFGLDRRDQLVQFPGRVVSTTEPKGSKIELVRQRRGGVQNKNRQNQ